MYTYTALSAALELHSQFILVFVRNHQRCNTMYRFVIRPISLPTCTSYLHYMCTYAHFLVRIRASTLLSYLGGGRDTTPERKLYTVPSILPACVHFLDDTLVHSSTCTSTSVVHVHAFNIHDVMAGKSRSGPKPRLAGHDIMYYIMAHETTRGPCKSGALGLWGLTRHCMECSYQFT